MDEMTDHQLCRSFVESGEMCHFNQLVSRHIVKVRAMIYPMVLNDADADDLTQEVFLRVIRHIHGFEMKSQFTTWLYRIAMNTVHSHLRQKRRNVVDHTDDVPDQPDNLPGPGATLMAAESDARIEKALASLPATLRSAITLTCIQGMDVRTAAKVEGCLAATLYWRVHQARKILKDKLNLV
jgi:RNA polymerase sigma-70 factor (ECF subfamily)